MDKDRYEPNTIDWEIGDRVIHSCDAKKDWMLMKVIEKKDGKIGTKYIRPGRIYDGHQDIPLKYLPNYAQIVYGTIMWNDKADLFDPGKFDILLPGIVVASWYTVHIEGNKGRPRFHHKDKALEYIREHRERVVGGTVKLVEHTSKSWIIE